MADGRVLISQSDGPLVAAPGWVRFDNDADCRCAGFDIQRGRQSELDVTDTGRARVYFRDRNNTVNDVSLIGCQIVLQTYNPVAAEWVPQFRGHIDNIRYDVSPSGVKSDVQFECVDIFDYLANVRFQEGLAGFMNPYFGHPTPGLNFGGGVFYEDDEVDGRLTTLATDAGLAATMYVFFSGNVWVNETNYDASDNVLSAMRDACDAEFPGIANLYVDRRGGTDGTGGRVAFHGRFARFDPEGTAASASPGAWDFTRWTAATGADVSALSAAQIRGFAFSYPRARIINSYVAWPRDDHKGKTFDQRLVKDLEKRDATSISTYGYRGRTAPDLIIKRHKTNGNTGADECELFGEFYVANYSTPRRNVETVTFKSLRPEDTRATATWETMLNMDISDILNLTVAEAEVSNEDYYVEGLSTEVRVLNPEFDMVTVTPNLSPYAYYTDNVFEGV